MRTTIIRFAFLLLCPASLVFAHSGATGIVKERMDMMGDVAASMKTLSTIVKEDASFDRQSTRKAAQTISDHSRHFLKMFPEGSTDGPSQARDEIWQDWDTFKTLFREMEMRSDRLIDGIDKAQKGSDLREQFAHLGETCGACHKKFRAKK